MADESNPATCTAAAPAVYSIFTGRKPYLDEYLAEQGKLVFIDQLEKVSQIKIEARDRMSEFRCQNPDLAKQVVEQLLGLAGDRDQMS